jgi:predicted DsbA family dithiol-disulfide isomerase
MESVRITHFTDALCVWAYVSEIRCDELLGAFPGRVSLDDRFVQVFGDVQGKIASLWSERGGMQAYAAHVREAVEGFGHVSVHPEVWVRNTPASSMPCHLLLCGTRSLEERGAVEAGAFRRLASMLREAFFLECAPVSERSTLLEIAERAGVAPAALEAELDGGAAHAALAADLELAREQSVRASPTYLFNEGRQRLTGNVGYRIIETNIRELLERPEGRQSWC